MDFFRSVIRNIVIAVVVASSLVVLPSIFPQLKPIAQKIISIYQHKFHPNENFQKNTSVTSSQTTLSKPFEMLWSSKSRTYPGTNSEQLDSISSTFIDFNKRNNSGMVKKFNCSKFKDISTPLKQFIDQLPVVDPSDYSTRDAMIELSSNVSNAIYLCDNFKDLGSQVYVYSLLSVKNVIEFLNWYRAKTLYEEHGKSSTEEGYIVHRWETLYKESSVQLEKIARNAHEQSLKPITLPTLPTYTENQTYRCESTWNNLESKTETVCKNSPF